MAAFLLVNGNIGGHNVQGRRGNALRRPRIIRDRTHPLDAYNDDEIKFRYRLTRELIIDLHTIISDDLEPNSYRNNAVPPMLQIFCTLRYYATGCFQREIGDTSGFDRSSASRFINRVTDAICRRKHRFIYFPIELLCNKQKKIFMTWQIFQMYWGQLMELLYRL